MHTVKTTFPRVMETFFDDSEFYFGQISDEEYQYLTGPRNYPAPCIEVEQEDCE